MLCGDNLHVLPTLPDGCIDLIYCDILYGTGKRFKDYDDIKADRNIIETFYRPRLTEMYRVLKTSGTIYLQMDLRIVHWVRLMMDDLFGYGNFRNQIVVKYNIGGRGKSEFAKKHDYLVVYSKSENYTFNDMEVRVPYRSVISKKQDRPNITPEKLAIGTIPTNVWDDIPSGLKVRKVTDYFSEKHYKLIERIVKCGSNEGDTVADFFCGSGTVAAVCKNTGRSFFGCDINERAVSLTKQRYKSGV